MHSRVPKTFGPPQVRAALFRLTGSGGIALNLPVSAEIPGQLSAISPNGGVRLALGTGSGDSFLAPSAGGGIKIRLAS
jgi:hypothetical protein